MEISSSSLQTGYNTPQVPTAEECKGVYLLNTSHRNYNVESFTKVDLTGDTPIGIRPFSHQIFKKVKKDIPYVLAVIREISHDKKDGRDKVAFFSYDAQELHKWKNSGHKSFTNPITNIPVQKIEYYTYFKDDLCPFGKTFSHLATVDYPNPIQAKADFIDLFLKANRGDPKALVDLGYKYEKGIGVEKNAQRAIACYQWAVKKDYPAAFLNAGIFYQVGNGVEQDINMALVLFQRGAELGDLNSLLQLGLLYFDGTEVSKDEKMAVQYFIQAFNKGHSSASYYLGLCYRDGKGVEKDVKKAFEYFTYGAAKGVVNAIFEQAECYRWGNGVVPNYHTAFSLYMKAAGIGHVDSLRQIGDCYQKGIGVATPDVKKALEYFQRAVDKGDVRSLNHLGYIYLHAIGVIRNQARAFSYFSQAAKAKDPKGFDNVAFCYLHGAGVKKDLKQARKNYKAAAFYGNNYSFDQLAGFYQYGIAGKKKLWKAIECYQKVENHQAVLECLNELALNGDPKAQNQLGDLYRTGTNVNADLEKAFSYYMMAAEQSDFQGLSNLAEYYFGTGIEINPNKAVECDQEARDEKNVEVVMPDGLKRKRESSDKEKKSKIEPPAKRPLP